MTVGTHRARFLAYGATGDATDFTCDVERATIRHGRDDPTTQPEASTATLTLPQALPAGIDIGAAVVVDTQNPNGDWIRRFTGTVTDLHITHDNATDPDTGLQGVVAQTDLTAAGPLAAIGRRYVGDAPWPQELDGARVDRILKLVTGVADEWAYSGAAPDGWQNQVFGDPSAGPITADATMGAVKVEWLAGSINAGGVAWRNALALVAGVIYTVVAEVYVPTGMPAVVVNDLFTLNGESAQPAEQWQTITLTYVAPAAGDRAFGIAIDFYATDAARPAGQFCYVRKFRVSQANVPSRGIIDPGTVQILARDVDRQPAQQLAREVAVDASGILWETRDGLLSYADAVHRRGTPVNALLDACDVLMSPTWAKTLEGMINDVAVAYGPTPEGGEQPVYSTSRADSISRYGRYAYSTSTQLAALADAQAMAELLVVRGGFPAWNLPELPLDLSLLDPGLTGKILALDMHDLLGVTGLPGGSPATSTNLWVEGWAEELGYGRHAITLAVSAYCRTAPPPHWDDVPSTITWDTWGTGTWDDATCVGPIPSEGRWDDVAATLRWDGVDAAVTWDTWS